MKSKLIMTLMCVGIFTASVSAYGASDYAMYESAMSVNRCDDDSKQAEALLREAISEVEVPMYAGDGIVITAIYIKGDYLTYRAECDETIVDIDLLNSLKSTLKESLISELRSQSDLSMTFLVRLCIMADKGLCYIYEGDTTGDTCTIYIHCSELSKLL